MADKLLPCPFCGGEVELVKQKSDEFEFVLVSCKNCDATIGIGGSDNEQIVTEAWNKRPNPWHTGIPTEEGWYLLHLRRKDKPYCVAYMDGHHWLGIDDFYIFVDDVLAWQNIEPY